MGKHKHQRRHGKDKENERKHKSHKGHKAGRKRNKETRPRQATINKLRQ